MTGSHHHHDHHACGCGKVANSTQQTLDEMAFERGIWSAALNGDEEKVKKLLTNHDPNSIDASGYTALVCWTCYHCLSSRSELNSAVC